jgi:tetratricopeptide (TPR) repeat protein
VPNPTRRPTCTFSTIRLLETATWRPLATLAAPYPQPIGWLCFSPDGRQLAAACQTEILQLWDLRLIRAELAEMGLGWEPATSPSPEALRAPLPYLSPAGRPWSEGSEGKNHEPLQLVLSDEAELQFVLRRANHAIKASPRSGKAYMDRGMVYQRFQKYELALADYQKALDLAPKDAVICNNLAWFYVAAPEQFRNPQAGERLVRKAVALDPRNWLYLNTLGVALYRLDKWQEAVDALEKSVEASTRTAGSGTAWDWYFLAMSYHRLGQPAKAKKCYEQASNWGQAQRQTLSPFDVWQLDFFHAEAQTLLGRPPEP